MSGPLNIIVDKFDIDTALFFSKSTRKLSSREQTWQISVKNRNFCKEKLTFFRKCWQNFQKSANNLQFFAELFAEFYRNL